MSKKQTSDKNPPVNQAAPKKEICKRLVDRLVSRRTFEPFDRPTVGCRFYRFRIRGETITGRLGFPISNFQQGTSYALELNSGEIVEVVGNKLLHKQIREGELCGQRVQIVYMGRDFTHGGHHRKIYRVFKIGQQPALTHEQWDRLLETSKKTRNSKRIEKNG